MVLVLLLLVVVLVLLLVVVPVMVLLSVVVTVVADPLASLVVVIVVDFPVIDLELPVASIESFGGAVVDEGVVLGGRLAWTWMVELELDAVETYGSAGAGAGAGAGGGDSAGDSAGAGGALVLALGLFPYTLHPLDKGCSILVSFNVLFEQEDPLTPVPLAITESV